jgi:hypothetical protein
MGNSEIRELFVDKYTIQNTLFSRGIGFAMSRIETMTYNNFDSTPTNRGVE